MNFFIVAQAQAVQDRVGKDIHLLVSFVLLQFLDNNDAPLIYCCDKIFALSAENALYTFDRTVVFSCCSSRIMTTRRTSASI